MIFKRSKVWHVQEYISPDILDEDYVKVFSPFRFVQKILGSSRVDIRDRFVTAPTILQKSYTVICLAFVLFGSASLLKSFANRHFADSQLVYLWVGGVFGLFSVFVINFVYVRFFNNNSNVKFLIKMQEIDRIMCLNRNKINNWHYAFNISVTIIMMTAIGGLGMTTSLLSRDNYAYYEIFGVVWAMNTFVIEMNSCASYMKYFSMRVRLINSMIINHFTFGDIKSFDKQSKYFDIAAEWQEFESSDPDIYMKEIFSGYSSYQNQYRFQVILICTTFVAWVLFMFGYVILAMQKNVSMRFLLLDFIQLIGVFLALLILLLILCLRCERFTREVHKTKKLSILVLSRYMDGPLRRKAKAILSLIDDTPAFFSVYGMWRMDARLLFSMFNIVTGWLVTILQFTVL